MTAIRAIRLVIGVGLLALLSRAASAETWYVDNQAGNNGFDGLTAVPVDESSGPLRTISRALQYARFGDRINIANHGVPYYESLHVAGPRFTRGGLIIEGNGAIVSGAQLIPPNTWRGLADGNWKFTPRRKGFFQLLLVDRPVSEQPVSPGVTVVPELPAGHWCAWRGSIYYRPLPGLAQSPPDLPLAFAAREVGATLLDADDVTIRNLTFRHFRLDGVNAHDRCRGIILENVKLLENGRAGLAAGGTSLVGLSGSELSGNRLTQILNAEVAQTEIVATTLGDAPGGPFQIRGGHLLIDGVEVFGPAR